MLLFYAATQAVQDCTIGLFAYENCLWLWVRDQLGLPQNKLLCAATLELVGLALLLGFYATFRYVLPMGEKFRRRQPEPVSGGGSESSTPPAGDSEESADR
jgi:hypothetical protein